MPFDGTGSTGVTQALLDGRRRIERGWCQNFRETEGRVCLLGALGDRPDREAYCAARNLLWDAIMRVGFKGNPIEFNDYPGRTKEEILAVYDAAIARAL